MKLNESATNPMFVGAMQLMKAEDTPEHRKLFSEELKNATLLSPVYVLPEPQEGPDGKKVLAPGSKVQFPMITTKDKKTFFVMYTDLACMEAAIDAEGNPTPEIFRSNYMAVDIAEIGGLLAQKGPNGEENPASGIIINPFNENMVVGKEMAIYYFERKMEAVRAKAEAAMQEKLKSQEDPDKVIPFTGNRK